MDHFRHEKLRSAIRDHLTEHGRRKWKLVRERFADVPQATFWRTVKNVRIEGEVLAKGNTKPSTDPAAEPPLLFPDYCEPLQKLAEYETLIRSAQELIDQAKGRGGKIKNWQMHAKGVALRESLVRNQVQVMGELTDLDFQARFYQAVFDLVDEMAPDLQKRFVVRFHELSKLSGDALRAATPNVNAAVAQGRKGGR